MRNRVHHGCSSSPALPDRGPAGGAGNVEEGNAARDAIAVRYPSAQTEVRFQTAEGLRSVDVLTPEGEAIESKVGYTSLSSVIRGQIAKGQLLMQEPQITGVGWIFSANNFGEVGPSGPLANALEMRVSNGK